MENQLESITAKIDKFQEKLKEYCSLDEIEHRFLELKEEIAMEFAKCLEAELDTKISTHTKQCNEKIMLMEKVRNEDLNSLKAAKDNKSYIEQVEEIVKTQRNTKFI